MSMRVAFLVGHQPSSATVLHAIPAGMPKAGGDANVYESPYEPALLRADVVALRGLDLAAPLPGGSSTPVFAAATPLPRRRSPVTRRPRSRRFAPSMCLDRER